MILNIPSVPTIMFSSFKSRCTTPVGGMLPRTINYDHQLKKLTNRVHVFHADQKLPPELAARRFRDRMFLNNLTKLAAFKEFKNKVNSILKNNLIAVT